jgi:hypothetical protein
MSTAELRVVVGNLAGEHVMKPDDYIQAGLCCLVYTGILMSVTATLNCGMQPYSCNWARALHYACFQ